MSLSYGNVRLVGLSSPDVAKSSKTREVNGSDVPSPVPNTELAWTPSSGLLFPKQIITQMWSRPPSQTSHLLFPSSYALHAGCLSPKDPCS
ncbi:hypothetical protein V6N13_012346 [Hibiscus sabdariffa]|uniref:Uncharacterized protein n=1 Tax=Hibiscus sabdariffa TaxID=183260 RepID=A0ABR2SF34_9ROSI